jgi:hypothetical protein
MDRDTSSNSPSATTFDAFDDIPTSLCKEKAPSLAMTAVPPAGPETPAGSHWQRRENEQGRKYWQNSVTREKTFTKPQEVVQAVQVQGQEQRQGHGGGEEPDTLKIFPVKRVAPSRGPGFSKVDMNAPPPPPSATADLLGDLEL